MKVNTVKKFVFSYLKALQFSKCNALTKKHFIFALYVYIHIPYTFAHSILYYNPMLSNVA